MLLLVSLMACAPLPVETGLRISEVMSANGGSLLDDDGDPVDWIELHHTGATPIALQGWALSDNRAVPQKWVLPYVVMDPGAFLVVYASGKDRRDTSQPLHTGFRLKASGEALFLTHPEGRLVDHVVIPPASEDVSWGRVTNKSDQWSYFHRPTPGVANDTEGWSHPLLTTPEPADLFLSEFLVSDGKSSGALVVDEDGDAVDWIELRNGGAQALDLMGHCLSDNVREPEKWCFPPHRMDAGTTVLVYASGKDRRPLDGAGFHTNFRLDGEKDAVVLTTPFGQVVDAVSTSGAKPGLSMGRPDGDRGLWLHYPTPTPGQANTTRGFGPELAPAAVYPLGLQINEVVAQQVRVNGVVGPDWIELFNAGSSAVALSGIGLSDDPEDPFRWRFSGGSLAPGQYRVVDLADGPDAPPFSLDSRGETLVLTQPDGRVLDRFETGRLRAGVSSGRRVETGPQRLFFLKATPGRANTSSAFTAYAARPVFQTKGGPQQGVVEVAFEDPAPGTVIRYTWDGGEPSSHSSVYHQPIRLRRSRVVRARAFRADRMPSDTVTRTFLVDRQHELVTLALSTDHRDLFEPEDGLYMKGEEAESEFPFKGANFWEDEELAAHLELYEPDGTLGLDMDLGLKIFGAYSRGLPKKSFQLIAREDYGQEAFEYPIFPNKPGQDLVRGMKRIVLRQSGQDAFKTHFRDVLLTRLVADSGIDHQAHRMAVLYINGRYWGLYNIREKINADFIATNHGVEPDDVDLLCCNGRAEVGTAAEYRQLLRVVSGLNLQQPKTRAWVESQMDVDNFLDYQVFQMFFANVDNGNIRFWKERTPEGRWRWILFDLDHSFQKSSHATLHFITDPRGTGAKRLFSTRLLRSILADPDYRERFLTQVGVHLNTTFDTARVLRHIDALATAVASEIPDEGRRWWLGRGKWHDEVDKMRQFARMRPRNVRAEVQGYFELSDTDMQRLGLTETLRQP